MVAETEARKGVFTDLGVGGLSCPAKGKAGGSEMLVGQSLEWLDRNFSIACLLLDSVLGSAGKTDKVRNL